MKASKTETMMLVSSVSRKQMKKTGRYQATLAWSSCHGLGRTGRLTRDSKHIDRHGERMRRDKCLGVSGAICEKSLLSIRYSFSSSKDKYVTLWLEKRNSVEKILSDQIDKG